VCRAIVALTGTSPSGILLAKALQQKNENFLNFHCELKYQDLFAHIASNLRSELPIVMFPKVRFPRPLLIGASKRNSVHNALSKSCPITPEKINSLISVSRGLSPNHHDHRNFSMTMSLTEQYRPHFK
jgi:hypothetical protein